MERGKPLDIKGTLTGAYLTSGDAISLQADDGAGLILPATVSANGSFIINLSASNSHSLSAGPHTFTVSQPSMATNVAANNNPIPSTTFTLTVEAQSTQTTPVPTLEPRVTTNRAPVITSTNRYTCQAETGGTFQVTATGKPEGFRYSLNGAPIGVSINSMSGKMSVPGTVAADTYTFMVNVDNGVNPIAVQDFTLTVEAPPAAPVLPLEMGGLPEGGTISVGDTITLMPGGEAEPQIGSTGWTWDSAYFDATFNNGTATFTPKQPGISTISYTAADGQTVSFDIGILEEEDPVPFAGPEKAVGGNPWLWVGIAAGLVLVALALLWFFVWRKRGQAADIK